MMPWNMYFRRRKNFFLINFTLYFPRNLWAERNSHSFFLKLPNLKKPVPVPSSSPKHSNPTAGLDASPSRLEFQEWRKVNLEVFSHNLNAELYKMFQPIHYSKNVCERKTSLLDPGNSSWSSSLPWYFHPAQAMSIKCRSYILSTHSISYGEVTWRLTVHRFRCFRNDALPAKSESVGL